MPYNPYAKYGLTQAGYETILAGQGMACAICKQVPAKGIRLAVDHSHTTGKVRGLLCQGCNAGLGMFRDNPERLEAAMAYLGKNQGHLDQAQPGHDLSKLRQKRQHLAELVQELGTVPDKVQTLAMADDGSFQATFRPVAAPVPAQEQDKTQQGPAGPYQDLSSRPPMTIDERDQGTFPIPAYDLALEVPRGMEGPVPYQEEDPN